MLWMNEYVMAMGEIERARLLRERWQREQAEESFRTEHLRSRRIEIGADRPNYNEEKRG